MTDLLEPQTGQWQHTALHRVRNESQEQGCPCVGQGQRGTSLAVPEAQGCNSPARVPATDSRPRDPAGHITPGLDPCGKMPSLLVFILDFETRSHVC